MVFRVLCFFVPAFALNTDASGYTVHVIFTAVRQSWDFQILMDKLVMAQQPLGDSSSGGQAEEETRKDRAKITEGLNKWTGQTHC